MRFLLFIALALLPLSAALKCHVGKSVEVNGKKIQGSYSGTKEEVCIGSKVCIWIEKAAPIESTELKGKATYEGWKCGKIQQTSCDAANKCVSTDFGFTLRSGSKLTIPTKACCCEGDLCNGKGEAPKPPGPAVPLKCHVGTLTKISGVSEDGKTEESACPIKSTACAYAKGSYTLTLEGVSAQIEKTVWQCGDDDSDSVCDTSKCDTMEVAQGEGLVMPVTACCCMGDLCNGKGEAPKPPGPEGVHIDLTGPSAPSGDSSAPSGNPSASSGNNSSDSKGSKSEESTSAATPTALLFPLAALAAMLAARV